MKTNSTCFRGFLLPLFSLGISAGLMAQTWCVPSPGFTYSTMPGITKFTLNTINRTSPAYEGPSAYVNTGLSTNLVKGNTYNVNVQYTIDQSICPDMNIRVWIDFNQDGQLDDPGETVVLSNAQTSLNYNGTITIPNTANLGTTRLRVTVKMTSNGGHTLPTPCNVPQDPLGYHGEFEDYTVVLTNSTTGMDEYNGNFSLEISPVPASDQLNVDIKGNIEKVMKITIADISGKILITQGEIKDGKNLFDVSSLPKGLYFVVVELSEGGKMTKKFVK